jgi:two-component system KDP operon response regulator KdpE
VDLIRREVTVEGLPVHLSPNEFDLLAALVRHAGKVLTHRQLLREVWGDVPAAQPTYVRVYMAGLRKKLEPDPPPPAHDGTRRGLPAQALKVRSTLGLTHVAPLVKLTPSK